MPADTLLYDCFSGISGDMHIGAMLDLGVDADWLRDALAKLSIADEFRLEAVKDVRGGISGTRATVRLTGTPDHHRHLADIEKIITEAAYPARVEDTALGIFRRLAEAEARVHAMPVEAVHFHEVGATDAIVDIVAAALCLEALGIRRAYCRTLEVGGGMVRCAHGTMPVPAPATAEILTGVPCRFDGVDQEATTPTGAAILREVVGTFQAPAGFRAERVAYGVGQKDFDIPNVLRVMLGTLDADAQGLPEGLDVETNQVIHCNIDDMPAEAFAPLMDALLAAGARDVYLTPIIMKKSRPATRVSVLCHPSDTGPLQALLFTHSTTIGVRIEEVEKRMLPREIRTVATSLGEVRVKMAILPNGARRWKLEHDDVARLARQAGKDYLSVRRQLAAEVSGLLPADAGGSRQADSRGASS